MRRQKNNKIIFTCVMLSFAVFSLLPFLWMISTSFKIESDVFKFPIEWIPKRNNGLTNYQIVWSKNYNFALNYFNSIKVSMITTIIYITICSMAAYMFAKINFVFKNQLFIVFLATMMVPAQVTIVPTFMIFRWLGLYNSHLSLIIHSSVSVYGIFLMRQFMIAISDSLIEAAKIDGANHLIIFMRIVLPISKPVLATLAILKFVWTWNDYQGPLVLINDPLLYTIQLGMKSFANQYGQEYSLIMAAAVSAILPLLIIFMIGQKSVIEGIASGGVKG